MAVLKTTSDMVYFTMGEKLQELFTLPKNFMGQYGHNIVALQFKTFFMSCPFEETKCYKIDYSKGRNHQWEEVAGMNQMWRSGSKYVEIGDEVWVTGGVDESNGRTILK